MKEMWMVWFVPYQTYEEEILHGIAAPYIVAGPFPFSKAQDVVNNHPEYCIKPV